MRNGGKGDSALRLLAAMRVVAGNLDDAFEVRAESEKAFVFKQAGRTGSWREDCGS